jgi:ABC-2 type transport system permease protein
MIGFDLKLLARDRLAVIAWAVFLGCALLAAALGSAWADRHRAALANHAADPRFTVEEPSVEATSVSKPLILPAAPLLDLTIGRADLEPSLGAAGFFSRADTLFTNYELEGPLALANGRFDLSFVTVWLAPLLLIALGLSIASADRDSGLLRQQGAAPVGLRRVALERAVLRWRLVFVPIALVAIGTALAAPPAPEKAIRLALWLAVAGGYLLLWQAAILFASTLRVRQEALGAGLLMLWALIVLVVPAFGSAAAQALHPPPSRFTLIAEARAAEVAARQNAPELLNKYMHDHPELLGKGSGEVESWVKTSAMTGRQVEAAIGPMLARFEQSRERQRGVARSFELLSPALLTHRLLADVAGTGEARHAAFRAASVDFHRNLKAELTGAGVTGRKLTRAQAEALSGPRIVEPRAGLLAPLLLLVAAAALCLLAARRLTPANAI